MHPPVGEDIARREAKRLEDMAFGLLAATQKILGQTDRAMSVGQIAIERQRLLAFSDALDRAVCKNLDKPKIMWAEHGLGRGTEPWSQAASAAAKCATRSSV